MEIPSENMCLFPKDNSLNLGDEVSPHQDAPLLGETRQSEHEAPGGEVELEGNQARDMQSQMSGSENIGGTTVIVQPVQNTDTGTNSKLNAASDVQRLRKREIDRAYRERQKEKKKKVEDELQTLHQENAKLTLELEDAKRKPAGQKNEAEECAIKQKQEEELQTLRQENAKLQLELEAAKQKADKIMRKPADQKKVSEECRIEFDLDFPDEVAKQKVMMTAGGFPGINSIKMDMRGKRMFLGGIDIDSFALTDKLRRICSTKLVHFSTIETKKEEKKMDMDKPYFDRTTNPCPPEPLLYQYAPEVEGHFAIAKRHFSSTRQVTRQVTDESIIALSTLLENSCINSVQGCTIM